MRKLLSYYAYTDNLAMFTLINYGDICNLYFALKLKEYYPHMVDKKTGR